MTGSLFITRSTFKLFVRSAHHRYPLAAGPTMTLADYLAKNYLTADAPSEKKSKKRKRKDGNAQGLVVAEDDATGWEHSRNAAHEDDEGPLTGPCYTLFCLSLRSQN